ncbi:hypothetical protein NOF55_09285 [Rhizobiaceae bacterium BDR2-2]|uniref:Biotin carboxyl carrier protein n=1 Tax=Ectorhizobium quercum TaxID=2965071 RepID=A0AAE3SUP3_9HYPH|nr:hypothetical protein [Ectorhizobium quercum]MCX8997297.1 hypothetical protein [Ectorhizobium quercum]
MPRRDRSKDRNTIGDLTDPAVVSLLSGWLETSGARELEIIAADGQTLKIVLEGVVAATAGGRAGVSQAAEPASRAAGSVKAPAAGRFRDVHPGAVDAAPPRKGQRLGRGAVVGFIEIGPVLLPVVAGEDAVAGDLHVRAGDLVGYGETILTMEQAR